MYLRDVLEISAAHKIKIKNWDTSEIVWDDAKYSDGYEDMLKQYGHYYVAGIKATSSGYARNNIKSILILDIQMAHPLLGKGQ